MKRIHLTLLLSSLLAAQACYPNSAREIRDFLKLSWEEQEMALSTSPLSRDPERQLDIYLEVLPRQHPPNIALADVLARRGSELLPLMRQRMENTKDDQNRANLLLVIEAMQSGEYYCVRCDEDLMAYLESVLNSMRPPWWQSGYDRLYSIRGDDQVVREE